MKQTRFTKCLSLAFAMFALCSMQALAATYYSKVVATAVSEGMVCVSAGKTDTPTYDATSELTQNKYVLFGSAPTHTYHIYAQPNEGYDFAGWYENADCSGAVVSTESYYSFSFKAESTNSGSPTTRAYYAKFVEKGKPSLIYSESRIYLNLSEGTTQNTSLKAQNAPAITYASSNERVATVNAEGIVTAKKNGSCTITASCEDASAEYVLTVVDDIVAGKTQIGNGDFEDWRSNNHAQPTGTLSRRQKQVG